MKRVRVIISGRVIGVFFRANTRKRALKLGVKGYIKNVGDKVEAVFEGSNKAVDKLLEFCREGPVGAIVEDVEIKEEQYKGEFKSFEVIY